LLHFLEGRRTSEIPWARACRAIRRPRSGAVKSSASLLLHAASARPGCSRRPGARSSGCFSSCGLRLLSPFPPPICPPTSPHPRTEREKPMSASERRAFPAKSRLARPGGSCLVYFFLTSYRRLSRHFRGEIWADPRAGQHASVFTHPAESPSALSVSARARPVYLVKTAGAACCSPTRKSWAWARGCAGRPSARCCSKSRRGFRRMPGEDRRRPWALPRLRAVRLRGLFDPDEFAALEIVATRVSLTLRPRRRGIRRARSASCCTRTLGPGDLSERVFLPALPHATCAVCVVVLVFSGPVLSATRAVPLWFAALRCRTRAAVTNSEAGLIHPQL